MNVFQMLTLHVNHNKWREGIAFMPDHVVPLSIMEKINIFVPVNLNNSIVPFLSWLYMISSYLFLYLCGHLYPCLKKKPTLIF